ENQESCIARRNDGSRSRSNRNHLQDPWIDFMKLNFDYSEGHRSSSKNHREGRSGKEDFAFPVFLFSLFFLLLKRETRPRVGKVFLILAWLSLDIRKSLIR